MLAGNSCHSVKRTAFIPESSRRSNGQHASANLARAATLPHHGHLRRDHLGLKRRCELLRLREPEPELGQAGMLIALEAGDLHLRRQAGFQFRHQLHPPHQLWHRLTLVP